MERIKRRHAFTLAEVMIVLLVLTLLLAVFAPMITKRRTAKKGEDLWRWATRNYLAGPMDAFFNPEGRENASLFIGMTPDSKAEIDKIYQPLGKVIVRGGYINDNTIQHQIQLRHGRAVDESTVIDIGTYSGSILADNANLLIGSKFKNMVPKKSDATYPTNNIAVGYEALNTIGDKGSGSNPPLNNIAIGHRSSEVLVSGDDNVAVGSGAGSVNIVASRNTLIGADAGFKTVSSDNTLIGYRATSAGAGTNNVFIGAFTGPQNNYNERDFSNNTAIGYEALKSITKGNNNVAIGAGALKNLQRGDNNVAIGYNACAGLTQESNKTCIGYNSGPAKNSGARAELGIGADDKTERTYIGTNPNVSYNNAGEESWNAGAYGGDATLEIHNIGGTNSTLINEPNVKSNTTTIINGDLVVMGKTYFTVGNVLYPFFYENNLFGAKTGNPCSANQLDYAFNLSGNCSDLSNLTLYSDRKLKNIGSKFGAGLNEINQIKVYNYRFKSEKEKQKHTGVIAQQLQKIFPNSVFEGEDGYLKIRWDEMFYASINAIKELNHKISALMKQAVSLETKIQNLEKENIKLQAKADALAKRVEMLKNKK